MKAEVPLVRLARFFPSLLLVAIALGVLAPSSVLAHAGYKRSNPPKNAVIATAPDRVDVWFAEEVQKLAGANSLKVTDAAGKQVDSGDLVVDDDDRTHMSIGLQAGLPDGVYTVAWMTTSDGDGDTDDGDFTFTVDSSATATATDTVSPSPSTSPTAAPSPSGTPTAVPTGSSDDDGGIALPVLIVIVVAGVAAFLALSVSRRRRV